MLLCIETCVLKGSKRVVKGQTINDVEVPKEAMKYFEPIAINPAEVQKSLREVCYEILEIKKRLEELEKKRVAEKEDEKSFNRQELEEKAKELGIEFSKQIGDVKLAERIETKLKELTQNEE